MIDFRELVQAGVHFGHQRSRWCPKMAPYIWGVKNNDIHLINVAETAKKMEEAAKFLHDLASEGKTVLWVGTKKPAREVIINTAKSLNMPYVYHRWVGGTLSNYGQVKKSVTKLLHYEDVLAKAERFPHYTKKEFNVFSKMVDRLSQNVGGIRNLSWPVGALVLVDVSKERSALKEAAIMGIPVVAIVDTNGDPTNVDYVIPANDDAPRAISFVINYLADAVRKGVEVSKQKPVVQEQNAQQNHQPDVEQLLVAVGADDEEEAGSPSKGSGRGIKKDVSAALSTIAKTGNRGTHSRSSSSRPPLKKSE